MPELTIENVEKIASRPQRRDISCSLQVRISRAEATNCIFRSLVRDGAYTVNPVLGVRVAVAA